uniref:Uncharacterized protein n=1 Tax=viral metagenome TaxID=1070528 RepID=A0A6C0LVD9_9ZZZZ
MAAVSKQNITYCVSVMIQGVQCPAKRRGKQCHMAHTIGKVNPKKCNREEGGCRCKNRKYPFVCQFIHEGETKEMYSNRVGFDPEHKKFENCSYKEYESEYNECGKLVDELDGKIFGKFDLSNIPEKDKAYVRRTQNLSNIPEKDKAYVRRTQNSIHHICLKRAWLYKNMNEMVGNHNVNKNDKYYRPLEEKMKNREKVRAAVVKGKHVSPLRVFECEDDEEEFEHHIDECLRDATMECLEDGGGGDFDKHDYETYLEKEMVKSAIRSWDEQESGIHMKSPDKKEIKPQVSVGPLVNNVKDDVFKEEKKTEPKDAWSASGGGARIIHYEKQRELEKRVIAASKAEHERLHSLDEDDYLRDLDYAKSQHDTVHVDVNELSDDELEDEEALLSTLKSINEAHVERMRKERYKEKRDKWYYGED